jgi:hypothetical protein
MRRRKRRSNASALGPFCLQDDESWPPMFAVCLSLTAIQAARARTRDAPKPHPSHSLPTREVQDFEDKSS